ncbi:MAG: UDP-N-acetylglucosamine 1-carboxyvinyltransferase, partial [Ignavibacteriaceae bacterium]
MDKFIINGRKVLKGELKVSGAKNASLALMPASILAAGKSILKNTPELNDVFTMIKLLKHMGAEIEFGDHIISINTGNIIDQTAPY